MKIRNILKKFFSLIVISGAATVSSFAAIDIASQISTFTTTAETYATAAIPAIFTIVAIYFLIRILRRFTK